jgi:hypothetical protein
MSCAGAHKIINKFPLMQHGSVPFIYLLVGHAGVYNSKIIIIIIIIIVIKTTTTTKSSLQILKIHFMEDS